MHASDLIIKLQEVLAARCLRAILASLDRYGISLLVIGGCLALVACATEPLVPFSADTPPLVLVPVAQANVQDKRARFREIYCAVLEARGRGIPDYRSCEDALTRVGGETAGTGKPIELGLSKRRLIGAIVAGIGYECFEAWLQPTGSVAKHVRQFGYDMTQIKVDALSSSTNNARQIRDAIMAMQAEDDATRLVLIGYSKGAPDILEAVVAYPEIRSRVAAVVSAAGSIGGSALANDAEQYQADLLQHFPGATCSSGDGGAVDSLRPATRKKWLAQNPLPRELRYYSLITFPQPDRISSILTSSYEKLARIDARNDSQVIFYDQVIPGSALMGYINADHWALAVPISRTHATISSMFVTQNSYPREALAEAILRFVEEDLAMSDR
ncbi:MAG TPA: hypothetical protein VM532_01205 [Burkholderiales bacterium]|nr:hypothetical protein [Burkholderiales bacterium]